MWKILEPDDAAYVKNKERLGGKYPKETARLFERLDQLVDCLDKKLPLPAALQRGWIHHQYKQGMKSIDGGGGKGTAALRLYFFPDPKNQAFVLLGTGEKSAEKKTIAAAYEILAEYLNA
jgi:hypothetical protein